MRLIGAAGSERAHDQGVPIDVAGPSLGERAGQFEQDGASRQGQPGGAGAQAATAGVEHQRVRGEECFDLAEAQRLPVAGVEASGSGPIEHGARVGYLGQQRRHARAFCRIVGAGERRLRRCCAQRA